jgi:tRNA modification GTPase
MELGARLAEPGEFTLRAFLNGKMDLSQAEAVHDVIEAKTLYQAQVASRQRDGRLAREMSPAKKTLVDIIVQLESAVEFVEEDLPLDSREAISDRLDRVCAELRKWIDSYKRGRLIHEGFNLAVIGRPNVGKSSLFNALLAQERSIVTEVPGTTRDLVSELASLEGIPVRLVDTAGVRESSDRVERLGVDRSVQAMSDADALLLVIDRGRPLDSEDLRLRERIDALSGIVVFNKSDLDSAWRVEDVERFAGGWPWISVSAITGNQIEELRGTIIRRLFGEGGPERDGLLITNVRHCRCVEESERSLRAAAEALRAGLSEEFALIDLHRGLKSLGEITGETSVEDLLGAIFSRFCIGK